ncbi:hypothetical protein O1Q96_01575 (plasmid) [Streptomyces sp. Qhu-G9]|uniref:hypothetical protein n=1 Tax=Streptomyces sp. Qhu-G9 TaxID=3452799 RepID=UPI0022AC31C9|nr:hypothetical protein [Streptomyces aurantiacus]WAU78587.1 hypothetical protein O1Q96_01575 [Streptomyces aurantiacus]
MGGSAAVLEVAGGQGWTLPEPMLTEAVRSPALPASSAAEPKWDGFRAALSVDDGQVVLRSRRGTPH